MALRALEREGPIPFGGVIGEPGECLRAPFRFTPVLDEVGVIGEGERVVSFEKAGDSAGETVPECSLEGVAGKLVDNYRPSFRCALDVTV